MGRLGAGAVRGGHERNVMEAGGARPFWRLVMVVTVVLTVAAFEAPRPLYMGGFLAQLGATFTGDTAVVPANSAAARAGMRSGDVLDAGRIGFLQARVFRYQFALYRVGSTVHVPVIRANEHIDVAVTIERQRVPAFQRFVWIVTEIWGLAIVALGCFIFLVRPNFVTLAFFFVTAAAALGSSTPSYLRYIAGGSGIPYISAALLIVSFLGTAGIVSLCVRFPDGMVSRVGRAFEIVGWTAALVTNLEFYAAFVSNRTQLFTNHLAIASFVLDFCAVAGFTARFVAADPALRARMRWVGLGLATHVVHTAVWWSFQTGWRGISYEVYTLSLIADLLPIAFGYAVFRQRVIDVRFAGGRAVLYGAVSAIPFALFRMTDWLVRSNLEQARIATAIELAIAVAFGFFISLAQRRVDAIVERTFFRGRYEAERATRAVIEELAHFASRDQVDAAVVRACTEEMPFLSAAVFERNADGNYEIRRAAGFANLRSPIGSGESIIARLAGARTLVYLSPADTFAEGAGDSDRAPVLAVPVWRFDSLDAFVLVGRHRNGESPDPAEERVIRDLAQAAGTAYARIATAERDRTIATQERTIAELQRRLAGDTLNA